MGWSRREPGFRRPPGAGQAGPLLSHALLSGMGEASGSRTSEGPSRLPLPLSVWSPHRTPQPWSRPLLPLCMPPHPPRRHDPCRSPLKVAHPEAWPHVTHHCAWHLMWSLAPALLTWRARVGGGSRSPHGRGLGRRASAAETARVTSHSSPLRGTPAPLTRSPAHLPRRGQSEEVLQRAAAAGQAGRSSALPPFLQVAVSSELRGPWALRDEPAAAGLRGLGAVVRAAASGRQERHAVPEGPASVS